MFERFQEVRYPGRQRSRLIFLVRGLKPVTKEVPEQTVVSSLFVQ
jgi:hypothetical protein